MARSSAGLHPRTKINEYMEFIQSRASKLSVACTVRLDFEIRSVFAVMTRSPHIGMKLRLQRHNGQPHFGFLHAQLIRSLRLDGTPIQACLHECTSDQYSSGNFPPPCRPARSVRRTDCFWKQFAWTPRSLTTSCAPPSPSVGSLIFQWWKYGVLRFR